LKNQLRGTLPALIATSILLLASPPAIADEESTDTDSVPTSQEAPTTDDAAFARNAACLQQSDRVLTAAKSNKVKELRKQVRDLYRICGTQAQVVVPQEVDLWGVRCAIARSAARSEGVRESVIEAKNHACKGTTGVYTRSWFHNAYWDKSISDKDYARAIRATSGSNWFPQPWLNKNERVGYPSSVPEAWVQANIDTRDYDLFDQVNILPGETPGAGYWTTADENAVYIYPVPCDVTDMNDTCFIMTGLVGTYSDSGELLKGQAVPLKWYFSLQARPGPDGKATGGAYANYTFVAMPGGGWYWSDPNRPGEALGYRLLYRYASDGVKNSKTSTLCDLDADGAFPCLSRGAPRGAR